MIQRRWVVRFDGVARKDGKNVFFDDIFDYYDLRNWRREYEKKNDSVIIRLSVHL